MDWDLGSVILIFQDLSATILIVPRKLKSSEKFFNTSSLTDNVDA